MSSVLQSIIEGVREDEARRRLPKSKLVELLQNAPAPRDVIGNLKSRPFTVIAEVKRSSPSKGSLAEIGAPEELASAYEEGGASVVSVLTEERRFGGSLQDFARVRDRVTLPLLRKDFMVSQYLIEETRAIGADLVLLIVAALDDHQLRDFYALSRELGMEALIEVHDEAELERALALSPHIVGVNARNLKTLAVDLSAFDRLIPLMPKGIHRVAESGILEVSDARRAKLAGADSILTGEMLVRASDPREVLTELLAIS